MSLPKTAIVRSMPAPIGGWNARDPEEEMESSDAIRLINIFPETRRIRLRKGCSIHTSTTTGLTGPIEHMHEYVGANGTSKLIACANNKFWDCSTLGGTPSNLTGILTVSNNQWVSINFKGTGTNTTRAIFVNGVNAPKLFDGTTLTDAAYTGVSDQTKLSFVTSFKQALYFIENDSSNSRTSLWYAPANAFNGALKEFAIGSLLKRGGYFLAAGTFGRDSGSGLEDLFVLVSSEGEILIYSGTSPDFSDWILLGRYFAPPPLGKNCLFNLDSEVIILTRTGALPLSSVIDNKDDSQTFSKLTDKIDSVFNDDATLYGSLFGWEGVVYPDGKFLLVNVPVSDNVQYKQYVMNLYTGAWCGFTGWNSKSFCMYNDNLYMGGLDGKVYRVWHGASDNSSSISADLKTSFQYFDDRESEKLLTQIQPIIIGSSNLSFNMNVDTDFGNRQITDVLSISGDDSGSFWDDDFWDVAEWAGNDDQHYTDWYSVDGIGKCAAIRMSGNFINAEWAVSSFRVMFEPGGVM